MPKMILSPWSTAIKATRNGKETRRLAQARMSAILRVLELRIEEAQTLADMMDNNSTRKQMLRIASGYGHLANALHGRGKQ
jgi:hypothetical protein